MPGQFTVRGGIVDLFPAEAERPIRLELFGDTVESLREFDPNTQRSVGPVEKITLPPLLELPSNGSSASRADSETLDELAPETVERSHSLFDLREGTVVLLDEPDAIEEAATEFLSNAEGTFPTGENASPETIQSYYLAGDLRKELSRPRLPRTRTGLGVSRGGDETAHDSDAIHHALPR